MYDLGIILGLPLDYTIQGHLLFELVINEVYRYLHEKEVENLKPCLSEESYRRVKTTIEHLLSQGY